MNVKKTVVVIDDEIESSQKMENSIFIGTAKEKTEVYDLPQRYFQFSPLIDDFRNLSIWTQHTSNYTYF